MKYLRNYEYNKRVLSQRRKKSPIDIEPNGNRVVGKNTLGLAHSETAPTELDKYLKYQAFAR